MTPGLCNHSLAASGAAVSDKILFRTQYWSGHGVMTACAYHFLPSCLHVGRQKQRRAAGHSLTKLKWLVASMSNEALGLLQTCKQVQQCCGCMKAALQECWHSYLALLLARAHGVWHLNKTRRQQWVLLSSWIAGGPSALHVTIRLSAPSVCNEQDLEKSTHRQHQQHAYICTPAGQRTLLNATAKLLVSKAY